MIALTADGRATWDRLRACMTRRGPTFGRLTPDELATFRDLLRRITG